MTLLAALAVVSLQEPSLAQREIREVIPVRTGQNGYEEFLDAAYKVMDPDFNKLVRYVESWSARGVRPPASQRPPALKESDSLLTAYRLVTKESLPILALIEQGVTKPVSSPFENHAFNAAFHVSSFRQMGFLLQWAAIVDLADGKGSQGAHKLLLGIKLARLASIGDTFSYVVSRTVERRMIATIEKYIDLMPENMTVSVAALPSTSGDLVRMAREETLIPRRSWDHFLFGITAGEDEADEEVATLKGKISRARAAQIYDSVLKVLEESSRDTLERLSTPESNWLGPKSPTRHKPDLTGLTEDEKKVVQRFLYLWGIFYGEEKGEREVQTRMQIYATIRVRERLLKIAADVVNFRWEKGELPSSLSEIYGTVPHDPLNDTPYRLQRRGSSFTVALDVDGIGAITLGSGGPTGEKVIEP